MPMRFSRETHTPQPVSIATERTRLRRQNEPRTRISEIRHLPHHRLWRISAERYQRGQALYAGDPERAHLYRLPRCAWHQSPDDRTVPQPLARTVRQCHADEDLMVQYGINTNVFNSYLTDFHGTTVELFEQNDPNVATNKAVCFDCHGVHNIAEVSAENSRVVRENLLETCQNCHPDATSNFPDAWVGHYPPTFDRHPLLFAVNTFYTILIPLVLAGFAVLIALNVFRRIRQRGRRAPHGGIAVKKERVPTGALPRRSALSISSCSYRSRCWR